MKIIILGASGMLGSKVAAEAVKHSYDVVCPTRLDCDLASELGLWKFLDSNALCDWVINCAGLIAQTNPTARDSIRVNGLAPHLISAWATFYGKKVIHVSTDCVFSGREGFYSTSNLPDPIDIYGRSKLLGEVDAPNVYNIRTSFVGIGKHGFIRWLENNTGGEVDGWNSAFWTGSSVHEVARKLIDFTEKPVEQNIIHMSTAHVLSKYQLAMIINKALDLRIKINKTDLVHINRALIPTITLNPIALVIDELVSEYHSRRVA